MPAVAQVRITSFQGVCYHIKLSISLRQLSLCRVRLTLKYLIFRIAYDLSSSWNVRQYIRESSNDRRGRDKHGRGSIALVPVYSPTTPSSRQRCEILPPRASEPAAQHEYTVPVPHTPCPRLPGLPLSETAVSTLLEKYKYARMLLSSTIRYGLRYGRLCQVDAFTTPHHVLVASGNGNLPCDHILECYARLPSLSPIVRC